MSVYVCHAESGRSAMPDDPEPVPPRQSHTNGVPALRPWRYMSSSFVHSKILRISHPYQTQPLWRGRRAGVRLFRTLHDSRKFIETEPLLSHQQERANHPTHHARKKSISSKITIDQSR